VLYIPSKALMWLGIDETTIVRQDGWLMPSYCAARWLSRRWQFEFASRCLPVSFLLTAQDVLETVSD
jgi:hypothetical protein